FAASSVALARYRDSHGLFLLATYAAAASAFAYSASGALPLRWSAPVGSVFNGIWIEALVPACLWQFASSFPRVVRFTAFDRAARRTAGACWIVGTAAFACNLAVSRFDLEAGPFAGLLRDHSSGLFWRLFSAALTAATIAIVVRAQRAPAAERHRVARLAMSIGAGLGPFLLLSVARTAIPRVDNWFRAGGTAAESMYWLITTALGLTPIASTFPILVDRPSGRRP